MGGPINGDDGQVYSGISESRDKMGNFEQKR